MEAVISVGVAFVVAVQVAGSACGSKGGPLAEVGFGEFTELTICGAIIGSAVLTGG